MQDRKEHILGNLYAHIGNGGVIFSIIDEGHGPTVEVESSHFGTNITSRKVHLTKRAFQELCDLFAKYRNYEFSTDYCMAADIKGETGCGSQGCGSCGCSE